MQDEELIWERLRSESGPEVPLFRVRLDLMCHRATAKQQECLVLESPDWVNVVALTPDRRVVMVEQYRFGSGEIGLEPSGPSPRHTPHFPRYRTPSATISST